MYKLKQIDSDMWSRMYFENEDTKQAVCFECDNNVAYALMKESFPEGIKFVDVEEYLKDKEDISILDMGRKQACKRYGNVKNYRNARTKFLQSMVDKYKEEVVFINEYGTPLGSDIYDVPVIQKNLYPLPFTKNRLYELKYKKTKFKHFNGKWDEPKINTFNWGILVDGKIVPEYVNAWQPIGKKREKLKRNPKVVWEFDKKSIFSRIKDIFKKK